MDCSRGLFNKITRLPFALATVIVWVGIGASDVSPQDAPAARSDVFTDRPRIDVATSITLEEARVIIEAATALIRQEKGHATIVVVDDNGNLVSMDRMNGTSSFFQRFAVGKAVGAVALQVSTADAIPDERITAAILKAVSSFGASRMSIKS